MNKIRSQENSQPMLDSSEQDNHLEGHEVVGAFLKSIVYGGIDGVINTTIILLTGVSANTPVGKLFGLCVSATVVGALDMGLCDYVSSKSQMQFIRRQEERQIYEIENMLEEEKQEMISIYMAKDYSKEDAEHMVELISTSKQAFVNIMMMEELGLVKNDDLQAPVKCGVATFIIFLLTGTLTLSPYILTWAIQGSEEHPWPYVLGISGMQLFSLGFTKGRIVGLNAWKQACQFILLGAIGTTIGYFIGKFFQSSS